MDKRRTDELIVRYVEKLSLYKEYASRIRNLIENLVELEGVESYAINGWAKDPKELESDLSGDLVTVRVLLRFPEDVYKIEDVVRSEFDVDLSRSTPSSGLEDPFRFGYPAVSYTLSLSAPRALLREWKKYSGLSFRLELRTMLQEVWASIAPRVDQSAGGPISENRLKRELGLLAALLEKADNGFLSLRKEADGALLAPASEPLPARKTPPTPVERVFTDEELYRFFREDPTLVSHWNSVALEAGFPPFSPDADYLRESFGYLCQALRAAEMNTIEEVKTFLSSLDEEDRGLRQLQAVRNAFAQKNAAWRMDPFSALFLLVLNFKWDVLKDKDLVKLNIKRGSDRISGASGEPSDRGSYQ
ncbi:MAG: RelA/SpoT domain-containing protein [Synergistaceae bacterium]|nr:RelA/SpoT domain-containing protein [Synergistaceae bacterium]